MLSDNQTIMHLKNVITAAFEDMPYPGDNRLLTSLSDPMEVLPIAAWFRGKHWKDLTWAALVPRWIDSLCFLSAEAFRFYLPAYMIASAEFYEKADRLPDVTINILTPRNKERYEASRKIIQDLLEDNPELADDEDLKPYSEERNAKRQRWFLDRTSSFTLEQKKAIVLYLKYMKENHFDDLDSSFLDIALKYWLKQTGETRDSGAVE